MPVPSALAADPAIAGPLGGLLLSVVRAGAPMLVVRAVRWWRDLARLGVKLPLFMVHDIGLLFAAPRERFDVGLRAGTDAVAARTPDLADLLGAYRTVVDAIATSQAASTARSMKLGDDLIVVVLARILSTLARDGAGDCPKDPAGYPSLPLDPDLVRDLDPQLPELFAAVPRTHEAAILASLVRARLRVLTVADATDLDTLRLLGMLGPEQATGAMAQVDLLAALASSAANDVVSFSLELLPSVLETSRVRAVASQATHAVHGYSGVGRAGSIDSMVLTELAWENEELARRMLDGELLYYSRERAPRDGRRLHHIVIDASASMRGDREVFARGLAIALGKKLQLEGEDVTFRFFDSRLYDVQQAQHVHHVQTTLPAAWILGFKGERGRNPARVFAQLATEMALLRKREARDPVVHLITHAALHVPRHLVQDVRRHAHLFAVFILPSGGALDLDWLDALEGHAVVDHATLQQKGTRAAAATKIVEEASGR